MRQSQQKTTRPDESFKWKKLVKSLRCIKLRDGYSREKSGHVKNVNIFSSVKHRRSQGVQWAHPHPQGGEKTGVIYRENL